MTQWPNWIDLIVVTVVFKACYNGFGRGLLTELLNLLGVLGVTLTVLNYWRVPAGWLRPWAPLPPYILDVLVFWTMFLALVFVMHVILRRVTELVRWERLHWLIQGIGLFFGGLRGLWWAGFLLIVFTSSGLSFLRESVETQSVLGPRLLELSRTSVEQLLDRFPGAEYRGTPLVPPVYPTPQKKT